MNLRQLIENYRPHNEAEARDRALMLYALDHFPDVLTRDNPVCHFTASNWITNRSRDKILLVHHNIYKHWAWTGGHADGEADLRAVALREAMEETGLRALEPLYDGIFSIQVLDVDHHIKRGQYVASHLHLDCCYLWQADENAPLRSREGENSGVQWVPIDRVLPVCGEPVMDIVYSKLNEKLKLLSVVKPDRAIAEAGLACGGDLENARTARAKLRRSDSMRHPL